MCTERVGSEGVWLKGEGEEKYNSNGICSSHASDSKLGSTSTPSLIPDHPYSAVKGALTSHLVGSSCCLHLLAMRLLCLYQWERIAADLHLLRVHCA